MTRKTVEQLLDDLHAGVMALEEVAADFATRSWPARRRPTKAQFWGVADDHAPVPNSWDAVDADSRLTNEQYAVLFEARQRAKRAENDSGAGRDDAGE